MESVEFGAEFQAKSNGLRTYSQGLSRPAFYPSVLSTRVRIGALDLYVPAALRPAAIHAWHRLARLWCGAASPPPPLPPEAMQPVVHGTLAPAGYRRFGKEALRVDLVEKLLQAAHRVRLGTRARRVALDPGRQLPRHLSRGHPHPSRTAAGAPAGCGQHRRTWGDRHHSGDDPLRSAHPEQGPALVSGANTPFSRYDSGTRRHFRHVPDRSGTGRGRAGPGCDGLAEAVFLRGWSGWTHWYGRSRN